MKKQTLIQIFCTKIGWLAITCILAIIFGILTNFIDSEWPYYAMIISFLYPAGLGLVMMAYAWIINPIRERKESKRLAAEEANKKLLVEADSPVDYMIMNPGTTPVEIKPLVSPGVSVTENVEKKIPIKNPVVKKAPLKKPQIKKTTPKKKK